MKTAEECMILLQQVSKADGEQVALKVIKQIQLSEALLRATGKWKE